MAAIWPGLIDSDKLSAIKKSTAKLKENIVSKGLPTMQKLGTVQDALTLAISMEQMAFEFYRRLSGKAGSDATKELLSNLADEERTHKKRLEQILNSGRTVALKPAMRKEISRYLQALPVPEEITFKDAVKIAIEKEHASMTLYTILAELAEHKEMQDMLVFLAQEEASHKLRFEQEYHRIKLQEN